jgi:hypothetical protein
VITGRHALIKTRAGSLLSFSMRPGIFKIAGHSKIAKVGSKKCDPGQAV